MITNYDMKDWNERNGREKKREVGFKATPHEDSTLLARVTAGHEEAALWC